MQGSDECSLISNFNYNIWNQDFVNLFSLLFWRGRLRITSSGLVKMSSKGILRESEWHLVNFRYPLAQLLKKDVKILSLSFWEPKWDRDSWSLKWTNIIPECKMFNVAF